jgi:hypothetical protein
VVEELGTLRSLNDIITGEYVAMNELDLSWTKLRG